MLCRYAEVHPLFRGSHPPNPLPELPQTLTSAPPCQNPSSQAITSAARFPLSKPDTYDSIDAETVATLLGVSTRQLSTYVKDKGCPCLVDGRQRTFVWSEVLAWYVGYKLSLERYSGPDSSGSEEDDPIRRKDTAVADLKELDLQQRRGQLVPMADVSRVLQDVSKGLQTEIRGLTNRIVGRVLAIRDQVEMNAFLTSECDQLCTRLSQLRFIPSTEPEPEDEDA